MSQYAYFTPYTGWEEDFPTGSLQVLDKFEWVQLDTGKITDNERNAIRNRKINLTCPICDGRMYYNKGFQKVSEGIREANKSPYFYHFNRVDCHFSESLTHALTKKFVFEKLRQAGYTVREEVRHTIDGKQVRADVAAYGGPVPSMHLKLVVEIQASDAKPSAVSKKINAYYSDQVPTAWVIVLDDLFTGYTGTKQYVFDLESRKYSWQPLQPGEEDAFAVTGKDSRAFTFLMDEYGYILAVNHAGQVFLIRRDPDNEVNRYFAQQRGLLWTSQDELFKITRIADKDIARALLFTPLRMVAERLDPEYEKGATLGNYLSDPKHATFDQDLELSDSSNINIDFHEGKLEGNEVDQALDPISLIQETWQAEQLAKEKYKIQQQEEKQNNLRQDLEKEKSLKSKLEVAQMLEEELPTEVNEEPKINEEIIQGYYADRTRLASPKKLEDVEMHMLLHGFAVEGKMDLFSLSDYDVDAILDCPPDNVRSLPIPVKFIRNEETIWSAYETLSSEDRLKLERNVFPEGLPPWFMSKMIRLNQKEADQKRKLESQLKRAATKSAKEKGSVHSSYEEQRFDF